MSDNTPRQERILTFIHETVRDRGYPPTVREIGEAVGLTSSSSVHAQLANLERKGLLHRDPTKPRATGLAAGPEGGRGPWSERPRASRAGPFGGVGPCALSPGPRRRRVRSWSGMRRSVNEPWVSQASVNTRPRRCWASSGDCSSGSRLSAQPGCSARSKMPTSR